jgi:hypothetical protein
MAPARFQAAKDESAARYWVRLGRLRIGFRHVCAALPGSAQAPPCDAAAASGPGTIL